jgi:hypothetical protein
MSDSDDNVGDGLSALMRMWMGMASGAMEAWQPWTGGSTASPEIVRQARATFFKTWSDCCDEFMRSPAFLDAQKQCMAGNLAMRKQARENISRLQHEFQVAGAEDIDQLMRALRRLERRLLDEFEDSSDRISELSGKIDALTSRLDTLQRSLGEGKTACAPSNVGPGQERPDDAAHGTDS